ncbi:hypothetical protein CRG98_032496, partial [Punica granatum]
ARHVRRQQLPVQRVPQNLRLVPRVLPVHRAFRGRAGPPAASALHPGGGPLALGVVARGVEEVRGAVGGGRGRGGGGELGGRVGSLLGAEEGRVEPVGGGVVRVSCGGGGWGFGVVGEVVEGGEVLGSELVIVEGHVCVRKTQNTERNREQYRPLAEEEEEDDDKEEK